MINRYNLVYTLMLVAFWLYGTFGFIAEEILPPLAPLRTAVYLLCDAIIAITGLAVLEKRSDKLIIASFVVIALASQIVNHESLTMLFNGGREFIGMLFALPIARFLLTGPRGYEFQEKFDRQLFIFLVLQAFCVTEQFLRYGANDHGGGSLGNMYSGAISTSIYMISFYLMTRRWNESYTYARNIGRNWVLVFLLFPSMLNETKVSFVYLIVYFLLLFRLNRTYILKILAMVPVLIAALAVVITLYLNATGMSFSYALGGKALDIYLTGAADEDQFIEFAQLSQDNPDMEVDNMWVIDLPRFTKIFLLDEIVEKTGGGKLLGAGVGQFKGGTTLEPSKFARENEWYLRGTRPMLVFLFIQLGWLGLIWFIVSMIVDARLRTHYGGYLNKNIKWFFLAVIAIFMVYIDGLRNLPLCIIMFYILGTATCRITQRGQSAELTETPQTA